MAISLKAGAAIAFAIALVPASGVAYFVHRDLTAPAREYSPTGHTFGSPSEGDYRYALLIKLTRQYVKTHPDASAAMRNGEALAPMAFLNEELEATGVKWRVREIHGTVADTFDVA